MAQEARQREIVRYSDEKGIEPFTAWFDGLGDITTQVRIMRRLERMKNGNYGDCKSLKDGVFELRLAFGAGYRVYFGEDGDDVVLLLIGGDKSSQKKDIKKAKDYWKEHKQ